jgi:hypothetical protein
MVRDARQGKFDAMVVHKFDRMARNRRDATVYKALFRSDLKIKVYSVTELRRRGWTRRNVDRRCDGTRLRMVQP